MVSEVTLEVDAPRNLKGGHHMYYRQPDGFITFGSAQKMDRATYEEGGWVGLPRYGVFTVDHITIQRPLRLLFEKGGAKEVPVQQLIEEGYVYRDDAWWKWHGGKPDFPQLAGVTIPPLHDCPYCERRLSRQAMAQHMEVSHARDVGAHKMAEVIGHSLRGEGTIFTASAADKPEYTLPYVCGQCGQGFKGHMPLAKHVKGVHG